MPITSISIENFKGVGERVTVPIRPITLLFGANSAGKSTILQALLYLRELLERKNPDADVLVGCGSAINLGGFRELVYGHDLNRKVRVGVTMTVDDDGLPEYVVSEDEFSGLPRAYGFLNKVVETVGVAVTVEWTSMAGAWISAYEVEINGKRTGIIRGEPGKEAGTKVLEGGCLYAQLRDEDDGDIEPPSSRAPSASADEQDVEMMEKPEVDDDEDIFEEVAEPIRRDRWLDDPEITSLDAIFAGQGVVPTFGRAFGLLKYTDFGVETSFSEAHIRELFSQVFVGAGDLVLAELRKLRYIGPIREIPPRNFTAVRSPDAGRWADGSAAWDELQNSNKKPNWLKDGDWDELGTGYKLEFQQLFAIAVSGKLGDALERARLGFSGALKALKSVPQEEFSGLEVQHRFRLIAENTGLPVAPEDVGVGISQVLPVAIGAMQPGYSILAVEQPELHVHPAVQCRLADLLANQILPARERIMLLETHSEHLILRLLRRIRERQEGKLPEGAPALEPQDLCVLYAENAKGTLKLTELPVTEDGDFARDWPTGFFEERAAELF